MKKVLKNRFFNIKRNTQIGGSVKIGKNNKGIIFWQKPSVVSMIFSGLAFVLAAQAKGLRPAKVNHRSISLTRQGVVFVRRELQQLGIASSFYSVGECDQLDNKYYLIGNRAVADAGQVLRHFLPEWYKI